MPLGELLRIVGVVDGYVKNNSQTMKFLELAFKEYDIDFKDVTIIACSDPDTETKDITPEYLQQTFRDELKHVGPFDILIPFGNNALCSTGITKQAKGINSHRRKIIDHDGMKVCATISPHLVMREPQNEDEFFSDLAFAVYGANEPTIVIRDLETPEDFDELIASARRTGKCAYDYECVLGDTRVTLHTGEIVQLDSLTKPAFIQGCMVHNNLPCAKDVASTRLVSKGVKPCWKITPQRGVPLTGSAGHPVLTQRGTVVIEDLQTTDFVYTKTSNHDYREAELSDMWFEFVGWYIAEGCRSVENNGKGSVVLSVCEQEYTEHIRHLIPETNLEWVTKTNNTLILSLVQTGRAPDGAYYKNQAKQLLKQLGLFGCYAYEKFLPKEVLQSSNRQLSILLRAMFTGDGHVMKDRRGVTYTTTSKRLAEEIILVLASRFGILTRLQESEDTRKESYKRVYMLQLTSTDAQLFADKIGFFGRKQQELEDVLSAVQGRQRRGHLKRKESASGFEAVPIRNIVYAGEHEVWDISVPETKWFVGNGIVIHNTTGLNPDKDVVVSAAFCTGETKGDAKISWFWAPYDKLKPRFDQTTIEDHRKKLRTLFANARTTIDFIGHNANFDDWNTEVLIGERFEGSTFDTMILKWSYDNVRPHGLKESVAKYLGIPEYDKEFSDRVKAIKKRRGNNLTHEEDFFVLKWLGVEPNVKIRTFKKKGEVRTYTWPETVDKGTATYAMCEFATIREYNAKDAVYTLMLFDLLGPRIEDENLGFSCDFRHTIAKEFMRMEQRGQFFDLETAIAMEEEAQEIEDRVKKELLEEVARVSTPRPGTKTDEFNPGSNPDILWVLFGDLGKVPIIDRRKTMFANRLDKESLDKICDKVERNVYGDFSEVRDMLRSGEFEYLLAQEFLEEEFVRITGEQGITLVYENKLLGLGNLAYDPVAVSLKTGEPGAGKTNLLLMQHQKVEPFINLLLMYRKVNKIRKTFLCKIMKSLDAEGLTRTSYKATGTDSGRGSSSGNYNAQNFPKFTRGIIRPRKGKKFLEMDLKAAEVRMLAAYCQDPELLKAIYAEDTHRAVGAIIFGCKPEEVTSDQRKAGKAQPLYSKILTPTGWTTMGDVQIGDPIIDKNGEPYAVLGKYPQGIRKVYRVTFNDNSYVDADANHLWEVDMWKEQARLRNHVLNTEELLEYGLTRWECSHRTKEARFCIQRPQVIEFEKQHNLIGAYALGAMLGDGNFRSLTFCYAKTDAEMLKHVNDSLNGRFVAQETKNLGTTIIAKIYTDGLHLFTSYLNKLGLQNATGEKKFIPDSYFYTSSEERLEMLRGLMDTDGSISKKAGQCDFANKSLKLVEQVRDLVLSFGGSCAEISHRMSSYKLADGSKKYCGLTHRLGFTMPLEYNPFRLKRKADLFAQLRKKQPKAKYIHNVEFLKYTSTCCIQTSSPTKTYITDGYTVTHNTTVFLTIYGGGADKLARFLGIEVSTAQTIIDNFKARFNGMTSWMSEQVSIAKTAPYYIYTPWGTRRTTKNILSNDKKTISKYERIATNSPIQGGAGELCFYYGCEIMAEARRRGYSDWFNLVNQFDWAGTVHDSLMFEVDEDLIWRINERWETNAKGEQEFKYEVAGPIWDMVKEIIDRTVDIPPLDTVRFEFDVELNDYWSCKPDLKKALDSSSNPEEKFLWELIKPELAEDEDKKELAEFFDEEEVVDF